MALRIVSKVELQLESNCTVEVGDQRVRSVRPGLTKEYTVSMNGVRQDLPATNTAQYFRLWRL